MTLRHPSCMTYNAGVAASGTATKQVSLRLPLDIAEAIQRREHGTATDYVVQAVREKLQRDREAEIARGLSCLAWDEEANDVSDFAPAQDKVILLGD